MESIEKSDDDAALKSIIDLAETCPKFLRPQLDQLFIACMKVYGDKDQEDSWRHLALEVLVTLCETAPAMVRKVAGNQLAQAIQAILQVRCTTGYCVFINGFLDKIPDLQTYQCQ